ncbi:hypothetical protein I7I50_00173 [Histoplasma capsulatum G186AR]|uniref:Uncharacterized protein n=1 Tax=Ajellomyces capsulatus TaxID=5037 RepID=A0A8H7YDL5_AJECA|nr:hypothetical protein I7I52_07442 [Histoplasma capsulatum]QSS72353.1 hypothetical protein I7I50_00173 [Histoplasma capsulatum G186AR]
MSRARPYRSLPCRKLLPRDIIVSIHGCQQTPLVPGGVQGRASKFLARTRAPLRYCVGGIGLDWVGLSPPPPAWRCW